MNCYLHKDDFSNFAEIINRKRSFDQQLTVAYLKTKLDLKFDELAQYPSTLKEHSVNEMHSLTFDNLKETGITDDEFNAALAEIKSEKSGCNISGGKKTKRKTMRNKKSKKNRKSRKYRK